MLSFNQLIFLFTLFFISSCNNANEYKRIRGSALGTSYSIIVDTKLKEHLIKEKIDSIFEVVNNSMSTYMDSSLISKVNLSDQPVVVDHHFIKVFIGQGFNEQENPSGDERSQTAQKNEQNAGKEADDASLKGKGDQDGLVDITI